MPPELDIEEGSRTDRGLKAYKDFIEVYTFNGKSREEFPIRRAVVIFHLAAVVPDVLIDPPRQNGNWADRHSKTSKSTVLLPGTNGASGTGVPSGTPMPPRAG